VAAERNVPAVVLRGERVELWTPSPADAAALLDFHARNRHWFPRFEPIKPPEYYTTAFWELRLTEWEKERCDGRALRFAMSLGAARDPVVGAVNLSQIERGPYCGCNLGYGLDESEQGRGLMSEALTLVIAYAFDVLNLHRLQAGYLPTNARSGRVLRRAGFVVEGYARDYLLIQGSWEDHILTSLTNPRWRSNATAT
jgi:ribosomal-protein-alanine N-acetyltransferase